jgi:hypothetical protein
VPTRIASTAMPITTAQRKKQRLRLTKCVRRDAPNGVRGADLRPPTALRGRPRSRSRTRPSVAGAMAKKQRWHRHFSHVETACGARHHVQRDGNSNAPPTPFDAFFTMHFRRQKKFWTTRRRRACDDLNRPLTRRIARIDSSPRSPARALQRADDDDRTLAGAVENRASNSVDAVRDDRPCARASPLRVHRRRECDERGKRT